MLSENNLYKSTESSRSNTKDFLKKIIKKLRITIKVSVVFLVNRKKNCTKKEPFLNGSVFP